MKTDDVILTMRVVVIGVLAMLLMAVAHAGPDAVIPNLPNAALTPGATLQVTAAQVCVRGYAKRARHVTPATKRAVLREYGLRGPRDAYCTAGCEVDHLVSLELGGSNDIKNLWPEPYSGTWNAHVKDRYENFLHRQVCTGKLALKQAQQIIRTNWIDGYKRDIGAP